MNPDEVSRPRGGLSPRSVVAIVAGIGLALLIAVVVTRPRTVEAIGTLDTCSFGSPVITFEGDVWEAAAPGDDRGYPEYEIPVLAWPSGMRFDDASGTVRDEQGATRFASGDEVKVSGTVVDLREGDIPPCFSAFGVRLEAIAAP